MESKNRGVWVFVAVVAVLSLVGCCALALFGAVGVPALVRWFPENVRRMELHGLDGEITEQMEETFEVGSSPKVVVSSFAGSVQVRAGAEGEVKVVATKYADQGGDLDDIELEMQAQGARVEITARPRHTTGNRWVEFVITVPAETDLDLRTGAGAVEVRGIRGDLEADAGAGGIEIKGAEGPARLVAGAGGIDYEGRPTGQSTFRVGAGGITLRLPPDADVQVDLSAGLGGVSSQLLVTGRVTRHAIHGTIGTGEKGSVSATAGVGGIDLVRK